MWNPATIRAQLARAKLPRRWLWAQLIEHDCDVSLQTVYNWLNGDTRPDDGVVELVKHIMRGVSDAQR